jgi:ATP-binding cassette, subfamily F, member 3
MLHINDLTYRIGERLLLDHATVAIPAGARAGLVGRNGSGKTTLFRLIVGEIGPETGSIGMPRNWRVGQVAQEAPGSDEASSMSCWPPTASAPPCSPRRRPPTTRTASPRCIRGSPTSMPIRPKRAPRRSSPASASTRRRSGGLLVAFRRLAHAGGAGRDAVRRARPSASRRADQLPRPRRHVWLETFVARYPYTVVIVSHDRDLLNRAVDTIVHLDHGKLTLYRGNYDQFDRQRRERPRCN